MDWRRLERKEIEPPVRSEVEGADDLIHFYEESSSKPPRCAVP